MTGVQTCALPIYRKHEMGGALIVTQWKEKRDVSIVCVCVCERERERGGGGSLGFSATVSVFHQK